MKKFLLSLLALIAIAIGAKGQDMTATPLTFEAVEAGTIKIVNPNALTIEYNKNGEGWTAASSDPISITVAANDVVQFRGDNESYLEFGSSGEQPTRFTATNPVYVYGNVMSLVHKDDFSTNSSLTEDFALAYLFAAPTDDFYRFYDTNTTIRNHSTKNLVLPATSVPDTGYGYMFAGCQGLTRAPELPATTLAAGCYHQMFAECTGLTAAPALPATTLSDMCYSNMFDGCTSLATAPALPATTLAAGCYMRMFTNCTSLINAPVLPATTLVEDCYHRMFEGCTSLQKAPTLPAPTLFGQVYGGMFDGCTSLNYVKCLATDLGENVGVYSSVADWLQGVSATGTFVKADEMTSWPTGGADGIPSGWTVMNTSEVFDPYTEPLTFEAVSGTVLFSLRTYNYWASDLECRTYKASTDTWSSWTSEQTNYYHTLSVGDKIQYRKLNTDPLAEGDGKYCYFYISYGPCYVYGNLMSMFNFATTLDAEYACDNLFSQVKQNLKSHPTKDLTLGATTLSPNCYRYLFRNCTGLTRAPLMPATTLAESCYSSIFGGCSNLQTAPELPATTLAPYCYKNMFFNCTSLQTAPELSATTLTEGCYQGMFASCSSLQAVPTLPATTLVDHCYHGMFENCTSLLTIPELPITTMAPYCYADMFKGCSGITVAPTLPATTLAPYCYSGMLSRTSITSAPALPVTDLAEGCYSYMFSGCTNLATAPVLPATTMTVACYNSMFNGCSSLENAPALPSTELTGSCYANMFQDCTSLTTAPNLPATTVAYSCYMYMFAGCTGLTKAPNLPAATLEDYCYNGMFTGCTNLNYVKCLATDISANYCTDNWLGGVAATGTFIKADGMEDWTVGPDEYDNVNGIPEGWTVGNASDYDSPLTFQAVEAGTITVNLDDEATLNPIQYKLNDGAWTDVTWNAGIELATNDVISFRGDNGTCCDEEENWTGFHIECSNNCYVYGNMMSLIDQEGFATNTTLTKTCTFFRLFQRSDYGPSTTILNHPTKDIVLPATTLTINCYDGLFADCPGITRAPALPATTLAEWCYAEMFSGCTNLAAAPELPATTLANSCYADMFMNCTSMTKAPDLPAETLVEGCYTDMFAGCINLNYVKCLATDISADYCTVDWLYDVAATGTFVKAQGMTAWTTGVDGIPTGWTVLDPNQFSYTVPASGIGTFSYDVAFTLPEGLTAYYCKTYDTANSTISVVNIDGAVPANTGVLLKGTPGETYILTTTTETPAEISDNALVAVVSATHVEPTSGLYTNFMMTNGCFVKIQAASAETKMPANRAYLQILTADIPTGSTSRTITLNWGDETTGIILPTTKLTNSDAWYTLDGRRMMSKPTQKGVYIYGGHKVVIK